MRNAKSFVQRYADVALLSATKSKPTKDMQDTALVDLCLHFLVQNFPGSEIDSVPPLLQGHLENHCPNSALKGLSTIRHIATRFCSRLAWRNALTSHKEAQSRTAYRVNGGLPEAQKLSDDAVYDLLENTLLAVPDYDQREVRFATAGDWVAWIRSQETAIHYAVPKVEQSLNQSLDLRRRSVNPPIQIRLKDLLDTARAVDAREAQPDFPTWLSKLALTARLERVGIECFDNVFFKDGVFTLTGTQHVVGMLSSGKSTLFLALLFLLVRPGYDKRVVVLSSDTASAATLVARLKAHGIEDSTVISSFKNREEHLSAAHWSTSGYPADQRLAAAAAVTESLGIACPLEGMQASDRELTHQEDRPQRKALVPRLSEKPCHALGSSVTALTGKNAKVLEDPRTCPLITKCPAHSQQHHLSDAKVTVMTPQAFLAMTPEKSVIRENLSFPELFQYAADVVLIDEVDSVQQTFDQQCVQDEGLLAADTGAFLPEHQRLMANSLQDRQGSQYARAAPVRWQSAFTRLQSSVAMVYFLLLRHQADLAWITKSGTFTAASILCDLWASGQDSEKADDERSKMLEMIAILASTLYSDVVDTNDAGDNIDAADVGELDKALGFLRGIQRSLLEQGADDTDTGPLAQIQKEIESGSLKIFAGKSHSPGKTARGRAAKGAPSDARSRANAVALALLTNVTLSTFAYLVRNQAAVEDEFRLASTNLFMSARRLMMHYGSLIPRPLYGTVFGLMFEQRSEADSGGALKLVNHLGVGRYLLTNMHRLLQHQGQAGPHVLLMSGTSWAGGNTNSASPRFDVQREVSAVLRQPPKETKAISQCQFEFVSLGSAPISVSGQVPEIRRENLRKIAELLGHVNPSGTRITQNWKSLERAFNEDGSFESRQRALLVTNNYRDAKIVANAFIKASGTQHTVYCLVPDNVARADGKEHQNAVDGEAYSNQLILLPRSRVESFGQSPPKSILVAPLDPISRGHNIVTADGVAAISSIYFLHRPHPRPDDMKGVVGMVNRFTMSWINNGVPGNVPIERLAREFDMGARRALNEGFALRTSYKTMGPKARAQYSWDIITQLWQTIGRGIRGGVPVYVGFIDERFAPHTFAGEPQLETAHSSCLVQCMETLQDAMKDPSSHHVANLLYSPFVSGLKQLFTSKRES